MRKTIVRVGIVILTLITAYVACWIVTAIVLNRQADHWISVQRQSGLNIQYSEPVYSGFPTKVSITYPQLSAATTKSQASWSWKARAITVSTRPLLVNQLSFNLAGAHTISIADAPSLILNIDASPANLDIKISPHGRVSLAELSMTNLRLAWPAEDKMVFALGSGKVSIERRIEPGNSTLDIQLSDIQLPAQIPIPLDPNIKNSRLVAEVSNLRIKPTIFETLKEWQRTGNVLEIRELVIDWPPFAIAGSGTATLDEDLQPTGTFVAKIQGFFEVLDLFRVEGVVKSQDASMAKIVLGLLSRPSPNGGPPELSVSITLQDQALYAGPAKLMDLPQINWAHDGLARD